MPFYQDGTFWVALVALVASLSRPFWNLIRRAKLSVEAFNRIVVTHALGNPQINISLILTNTGGYPLSIKDISLTLSCTGNNDIVLKVQNFFKYGNADNTIFFSRQTLEPRGSWNNVLVFFNPLSKVEEDTTRLITKNMRASLKQKFDVIKDEGKEVNRLVEIEAEFVRPAVEFFNAHNKWVQGEYIAKLQFNCKPRYASCDYTFRFALFESDISLIQESCDEKFKYGFGVIPNIPDKELVLPVPQIQEFKRV